MSDYPAELPRFLIQGYAIREMDNFYRYKLDDGTIFSELHYTGKVYQIDGDISMSDSQLQVFTTWLKTEKRGGLLPFRIWIRDEDGQWVYREVRLISPVGRRRDQTRWIIRMSIQTVPNAT